MTTTLALGDGRSLEPFTYSRLGDVVVGYIELHPRPDNGEPCRGAIFTHPEVEPERPHWTVEQAEPLTLSPSILCRLCGNHGFVRDGKWVPA